LRIDDIDIEKAWKAMDIWKCMACYHKYFDIAIIATSDNSHYINLIDVINYNPKLVICEKPLCNNLNQAQKIVEFYKQKNIPLMVDNTRNFIPELRNLTKEHGKAISGYALFNRGLLHSATHIFGFFRMLGCDNYKMRELSELDFRVWVLCVTFEDGFIWSEERITNDMPVPSMYDYHMKYVVENAFDFLEGKKPILYTGEDALKDIEECFNLQKNMI